MTIPKPTRTSSTRFVPTNNKIKDIISRIMKLFKITTLAIAALFMASCDDTTDSIGQSVTNRVDGLNISDARYNVITE